MIEVFYLIGLVTLLIQLYVLKHTKYVYTYGSFKKSDEENLKPISIPVWHVIVAILIVCIPYVGVILENLFFTLRWVIKYADIKDDYRSYYVYWRLRDSFLTKSI